MSKSNMSNIISYMSSVCSSLFCLKVDIKVNKINMPFLIVVFMLDIIICLYIHVDAVSVSLLGLPVVMVMGHINHVSVRYFTLFRQWSLGQ